MKYPGVLATEVILARKLKWSIYECECLFNTNISFCVSNKLETLAENFFSYAALNFRDVAFQSATWH